VVYLAMERLKTRLGGAPPRQSELALSDRPEPSQHAAE
jgi:hypothetical protein